VGPRVFVVEDSGHNYSDALRFGEIQILCNEDYPFTIISAQKEIKTQLSKALRDFNPQIDRLLLLGDPVLIGLCFVILSTQTRAVPILKWDRRKRAYQPLTILL
jgi:hypothetical protein